TQDLNEAKHAGDKAQRRQLENELKQERERQVGDEEQWLTLRRRFNEVLQTAIADGVVSDRRRLRELFRELQAQGRVYLDANQQAWMEVENQGEFRRVGLTAATIASPESDRRLALQLLLARMDY